MDNGFHLGAWSTVRRKHFSSFPISERFFFSFRSPISIEREVLHFHKNQQNYIEMISILAQERLLGASLGAVFTGGIVFYQRRGIHRSLRECDSTSFEPIQLLPQNASSDLAHAWNETVDLTFGQLVKFLSSRGW